MFRGPLEDAIRRAVPALLVPLALLCASPGLAVQEPEGWSYELWNELMSPYCPGRTLAECPSPQAQTLRMWLLAQQAAERGANAIVGIDIDYETVGTNGGMMMVSVSGTAVSAR